MLRPARALRPAPQVLHAPTHPEKLLQVEVGGPRGSQPPAARCTSRGKVQSGGPPSRAPLALDVRGAVASVPTPPTTPAVVLDTDHPQMLVGPALPWAEEPGLQWGRREGPTVPPSHPETQNQPRVVRQGGGHLQPPRIFRGHWPCALGCDPASRRETHRPPTASVDTGSPGDPTRPLKRNPPSEATWPGWNRL